MSRDKELWAMALWVEKHHGTDGATYIADQIARLAAEDQPEGVSLWLSVAERFEKLLERGALPRVRS